MAKNDKPSKDMASLASRAMKDPKSLTKSEIRSLGASVITQKAAKKKKDAAKAKAKAKAEPKAKAKPKAKPAPKAKSKAPAKSKSKSK